jgi:hypothetical protein
MIPFKIFSTTRTDLCSLWSQIIRPIITFWQLFSSLIYKIFSHNAFHLIFLQFRLHVITNNHQKIHCKKIFKQSWSIYKEKLLIWLKLLYANITNSKSVNIYFRSKFFLKFIKSGKIHHGNNSLFFLISHMDRYSPDVSFTMLEVYNKDNMFKSLSLNELDSIFLPAYPTILVNRMYMFI